MLIQKHGYGFVQGHTDVLPMPMNSPEWSFTGICPDGRVGTSLRTGCGIREEEPKGCWDQRPREMSMYMYRITQQEEK